MFKMQLNSLAVYIDFLLHLKMLRRNILHVISYSPTFFFSLNSFLKFASLVMPV